MTSSESDLSAMVTLGIALIFLSAPLGTRILAVLSLLYLASGSYCVVGQRKSLQCLTGWRWAHRRLPSFRRTFELAHRNSFRATRQIQWQCATPSLIQAYLMPRGSRMHLTSFEATTSKLMLIQTEASASSYKELYVSVSRYRHGRYALSSPTGRVVLRRLASSALT